MRAALALLALVALLASAGVAAADEPRTTATGFDHTFHGRNLDVRGIDPLPCSRCHTERAGKLVGKPTHAACFGACHGPAPKAPRRGAKVVVGDRGKVCMNCHAESALTRPFTGKLAASYPPYGMDPDFAVTFGHEQHAPIVCTQCHDMREKPARRGVHARCAECHDGSGRPRRGPAMSACSGCHTPAIGRPEPPQLATVRDSVSAAFSHTRHAVRGPIGKECATCHAGIRETDSTQLPRPTMQTCGTGDCHDGKGAFSITTACTRCHDRVPERFEVVRPDARFLHAGPHADVVSKRPCIACHALGPRGDTLVASHAACTECHADDFAARTPKTCGACHNASEPWRPLVADRAPAERTEFGATIDHDKHPQDCVRCHSLRTAAAQLRPPRGHAACTGAGCHVAGGGPTPTLETCSGCHRAGLQAAREAARASAPWSVRAAFDHRTHARAPDGSALACRACHTRLSGANMLELATPAKATCAPCHAEGKGAFKLTGTSCSRCHRGGAR